MKFCIVYGALRSGTTLLRVMLDGNPQLDCRGEADFLFDFLEKAEEGPDKGQWQINYDLLKRNRIYNASGVTLPEGVPAREAIEDAIGQMRRQDGNCVALMIHRGLHAALDLFPEAPVLHMLRDPRDVARSSIGMGWAGHAYYGADHWVETESLWQSQMPRIKDAQRFDLRYETLIRTPEPELRRLCDFLEVPYNPDMLSFGDRTSYSAPDVSLIEQWRRKMTPGDVALVEDRIGPLLASSGYAPSGFDMPPFGAVERFKLSMQNKSYKWKIRVKRYGLRDSMLVALAYKLNRPEIAYEAQARIDVKHAAYLK